MTPDDIRHAHFDKVRKGVDPEQVRDLLARVAFLIEQSPDIDLSEFGDLSQIGAIGSQRVIVPVRQQEEPVPEPEVAPEPVVDHRKLLDTLDNVIAATEQLREWRTELGRSSNEPSPAAPVTRTFDIEGIEPVRRSIMQARTRQGASRVSNGQLSDA